MYLYSKYDLTFVILLIKIKSKKVDCDIKVYIIFLWFHAIPLLFYSGKIIILLNGH